MSEEALRNDILKEIFNISVGKAAGLLSEIIDRTILLTVPQVDVLDINQEIPLDNYLPKVTDGALMVSSISFHDILKGKANLIFPAHKMRTFINLCMNENGEQEDTYFTDIDYDIIKEIGNIILNSIVGEVGNFLDIRLDYSLPEVKVFTQLNLRKNLESKEYPHILILFITFVIDETEIEGVILVNLTLNSLNELMKNLDRIEKKLYE